MKKSLVLLALCSALFANIHALEAYKESATVSYYADKFHGRKTANGETFDMNDFTCAHKSFPFNTVLRVTNLANGKSVDVRVNDRGPFVEDREADLSKAAAMKLDMIKDGTATVKIEIVSLGEMTKQSIVTAEKANSMTNAKSAGSAATPAASASSSEEFTEEVVEKAPAPKKVSVESDLVYDIQLASFANHDNAVNFARKLMNDDFKNVVIQKTTSVNRVVIRQVKGSDVPESIKQLESKGYTSYLIKERKD